MTTRIVSLLLLPLLFASSGCFGYRLVRPDEITVPSYDPRPVAVPVECDPLIQRAATQGLTQLSPAEADLVFFCQTQQLIRAQEEEAASRKLEAHAEAANFALRATVVVVGALVGVLSWVF